MQKIRVVELGFKVKGIPGHTNLQSLNDLNRDDSDSSSSTFSVNINRYQNRNDNNFCINTDNSNGVDSNISSNNSDRLEFEIDNNNIHSTDDSEHEVLSSGSEIFERNFENQNDFLQNDNQKQLYLLTNLKEWAMKGVNFVKIDSLLKILAPLFPNLPKSYKSLLHTPRETVTIALEDGEFFIRVLEKILMIDLCNNISWIIKRL